MKQEPLLEPLLLLPTSSLIVCVFVCPAKSAETVTLVRFVTPFMAPVNVADELPVGIVTVEGMVASDGVSVVRVMVSSPVGTTTSKPTVPVIVVEPVIVVGEIVNVLKSTRITEIVLCTVMLFALAVMV